MRTSPDSDTGTIYDHPDLTARFRAAQADYGLVGSDPRVYYRHMDAIFNELERREAALAAMVL